MNMKHFTFRLFGNWHVSVSLLKDLGLWQPAKNATVLIGWNKDKNIRLDALARCSKWGVAIGFVLFTLSHLWIREE